MKLSVFGYLILAIVLGAVAIVAASGVAAYRRKKLFAYDFGTVFFPFVAFYIVGILRPEFRIGWGPMLGSFATLVLSAYAFGLRVAVIDRWVENARFSSRVVFVVCVAVAVWFAATLAPLY